MEGAMLGLFMVSACLFGALLEHPRSVIHNLIRDNHLRRFCMGVAMGVTAIILIYSPWGQQSGAHLNPATTLTYFWLNKVERMDALAYIIAQTIGGVVGVMFSAILLRKVLSHPNVNYVVTVPGRHGVTLAWFAELALSFVLMLIVLAVNNNVRLTAYTGIVAGTLVALFITFEAPISGTSLNPARSLGSALVARHWRAFWVYLTAPLCGMLLAAFAFVNVASGTHVYCAKLDHCNDRPCIFRCEFAKLRDHELASR